MKVYKFLLLPLFLLALIFLIYHYSYSTTQLKTYFTYMSEELQPLKNLTSSQEITPYQIDKWDNIMFDLIKSNKFGDAYAARVYANVYTAQRDAAFISKNLKGEWVGNLDLITIKTLCLFFPNDCAKINVNLVNDPYSDKLTDIVFNKIKLHKEKEEKQIVPYPVKTGAQYWNGVLPYYGMEVGSWLPWFLESSSQFRVSEPPAFQSDESKKQLRMTKEALKNITPFQTERVVFWGGNPGSVTPAGQWLIIANDYMSSQNLSLEQVLQIRSILSMAIEDALIAAFDSKYTYWIKRPNMMDKNINTIMPTPNYPSYPAGHAVISAAAAAVLVHYFPQNKNYWEQQAHEAGDSRIWGAIHFPIDVSKGYELGWNVGSFVVKQNADRK